MHYLLIKDKYMSRLELATFSLSEFKLGLSKWQIHTQVSTSLISKSPELVN